MVSSALRAAEQQHPPAAVEVVPRPATPWYRVDRWPPRLLAPVGYWLCTRLVLVAMTVTNMVGRDFETYRLYPVWAAELARGHFPVHAVMWQYPPVAGLIFLAPKALPFLSYADAFTVLVLLCDALVLAMLLASSRGRRRSTHGAWLWVLGLPLMLQVPYVRFDVVVTALAVGSVLALNRAPVASGVLAGLGALVKVWPVIALIGAPRGRATRRSWLSAVATAAAVLAVMASVFTDALGFLGAQGARGIEVESVPGSLLLLAEHLGYDGHAHYRYGSMQFSGAYTHTLAELAIGLTVIGFGWLLWWRMRTRVWGPATAADAMMTAILIFVSTSRVISPQYLIWLLGAAAACLVFRSTSQRWIAYAMLPLTALTTVVYPMAWTPLLKLETAPLAVLLLRNAGLVALTLWSAVRLWRSSAPARAVAGAEERSDRVRPGTSPRPRPVRSAASARFRP